MKSNGWVDAEKKRWREKTTGIIAVGRNTPGVLGKPECQKSPYELTFQMSTHLPFHTIWNISAKFHATLTQNVLSNDSPSIPTDFDHVFDCTEHE
jgi:hypothetical protein